MFLLFFLSFSLICYLIGFFLLLISPPGLIGHVCFGHYLVTVVYPQFMFLSSSLKPLDQIKPTSMKWYLDIPLLELYPGLDWPTNMAFITKN